MVFITQRTNRHIVKELDTSALHATYTGNSFGDFGIPGNNISRMAFPWGIAVDASSNIYVCDTKNQRIVKLDSSLVYVNSYSTTFTIGTPYAILFDSITGDLYVTGVWGNLWVRIERLTTALSSIVISPNLHPMKEMLFRPTGICRGFESDAFFVSGANLNIFETIETTNFSTFSIKGIDGEFSTWPQIQPTTLYNSIIKHSNGDIYVNNGQKIIRAYSSGANIINNGDSNVIAKSISGLKEAAGGTILVYVVDTQTIKRYDENLNFVEDIYYDQGDTIADDAYDVADFVEI